MNLKLKRKEESAFTRWECATALLCIVLLLSVTIAALANSREPGNRAVCANNLRRLGNAVLLFSSEHSGLFPPRSLISSTNWWPTTLLPYYKDAKVLKCPSDNSQVQPGSPSNVLPRSYLINGWNDYWEAKGVNFHFVTNELAMPEADVPQPSQTLLFGEKASEFGNYHVDLFLGAFDQIDERRHDRSPGRLGGSNYAFVDGSVRFLPPTASFIPLNLWAITDRWRTNMVDLP